MTIDRTYPILQCDGWLFTDWLYLLFLLGSISAMQFIQR